MSGEVRNVSVFAPIISPPIKQEDGTFLYALGRVVGETTFGEREPGRRENGLMQSRFGRGVMIAPNLHPTSSSEPFINLGSKSFPLPCKMFIEVCQYW